MDFGAAPLDLKQVFDRFPQDAQRIRRLVLYNRTLRSLCEDYGLACNCLARFETQSAGAVVPEINEYRNLVAELEAEIIALLDSGAGKTA